MTPKKFLTEKAIKANPDIKYRNMVPVKHNTSLSEYAGGNDFAYPIRFADIIQIFLDHFNQGKTINFDPRDPILNQIVRNWDMKKDDIELQAPEKLEHIYNLLNQ